MSATPQPATSLPDARPASLVLRLTPDFALPFVQLARLDRPAGWQLLLAPCWQSTALAGLALHRGPNLWHLVLFLIGAIAMRGAGCTYNDILDRKLDAQVERTRNRPLPSGRVGIGAAVVFLVVQALIGLAVLLCFNRFSVWLGIASLGVVAIYPLTKRVTSWPQAALGLAFSWGALMGWSATFAKSRARSDPALRIRFHVDDRLRHDLCAAGRARRRDRRHPLDRSPVRLARQARRRRILCRDRSACLRGDRSRGRRLYRADRLAGVCRASRLADVASRGRGPGDGAEALSLQPRRRTDSICRCRAAGVAGVAAPGGPSGIDVGVAPAGSARID